MLLATVGGLILGYPVALVLSGVALASAAVGHFVGVFDFSYIYALPARIFGIMENPLLVAVPLFVFMGVMLQRTRIAEELLEEMAALFCRLKSGLGLSVIAVGTLLAASTGIVGATVVTMGLISLPVMLRAKYKPEIACGVICASGTLGQIIPPSIVLILLGDQISSAYQNIQMQQGNFLPKSVSIADLFMGALVPGLLLVLAYSVWLVLYARLKPDCMGVESTNSKSGTSKHAVLFTLLPPLLLVMLVLGSILTGIATATESAAVGALGALILAAIRQRLSRDVLFHTAGETTHITAMIFTLLIGAAFFTVVFRGLGGDDMVHRFLSDLPGGMYGALFFVMLMVFLLGFLLDFIEIIFVVVPTVAPILMLMGADPIWLAVLLALNLQTSFLTPPFGFALFYLRGVAPKEVCTRTIYRGVIPFILIQLSILLCLIAYPQIATWLPDTLSAHSSMALEAPNDAWQPSDNSYSVDF